MNLSFLKTRAFLAVAAALLLLWVGYCIRLWQPERQVALHQRHLLDAVEQRRWNALREFLADDFEDAVGHNKASVLMESRELMRHFFVFLTIEDHDTTILLNPPDDGGRATGEVRTLLRIDGRGTALVDEIKRRVNANQDRFEFRWRKKGWKPWEWELIHATHPLLGEMP